eukprot:GFYU01003557.1.p1 GENE.GFYU01003557.1~~GFYU01003557.1.p1  ORF type:complete len:774 (-),score=245.48 GFYU01003557.1:166-2487(-)
MYKLSGLAYSIALVASLVLISQQFLAVDAAACASGNDSTGKQCPPDDTNGPCPAGCELAATSGTAITCTKHATNNGFGVATPCGSATIRANPPTFAEPEVISSTNGKLDITLTSDLAMIDYGAFSMNSRVYCYNGKCTHPGPTLKVLAGDIITITLQNMLGVEDNQSTKALNTLRHPNRTNIHTHGLHVNPAEDNVMVDVGPGESKTYQYTIPADHMPGFHWYHSHRHGASALQVMTGMVGGIIVDVPLHYAIDPSYTAMKAHHMVLTHVSLCTCNPTNDPFRIIDVQELRSLSSDSSALSATVGSEGISDVYLVNGQWQPKLSINQGEWNRFDLCNAVGDTYIEVEIRDTVKYDKTAQASSVCSMTLLALDGVFLFNGPRDVSKILMAPASRASVAVNCDNAGTFYLQSNPQEKAADNESLFLQNLVTLEVTAPAAGAQIAAAKPSSLGANLPRPSYLKDLRQRTPTNSWQVGVEQTGVTNGGAWLGVGTNCAIQSSGRDASGAAASPNTYGSCPHVAFGFPEGQAGSHLEKYPYRHVGKMCDIEDMVVQGRGATPHPMHIHVNHFQIIEVRDPNGSDASSKSPYSDWGIIGDWRDTVPALAGSVRVRYVLDGYGANHMIHCHFLMHEDLGMMDRIWVEPKDSPVKQCTATRTGADGIRYCNNVLKTGNYSLSAFSDNYPSVTGTCDGIYNETPVTTTVGTTTEAEAQANVALGLTKPPGAISVPSPSTPGSSGSTGSTGGGATGSTTPVSGGALVMPALTLCVTVVAALLL